MLKKFNEFSKLIRVLLLVIPFVGWITEVIIRWSVFLEKKSVISLVLALVYTFVGWAVILHIIDAILIALDKDMLLINL